MTNSCLQEWPCHIIRAWHHEEFNKCLASGEADLRALRRCFRVSSGHFGSWSPIWGLEIPSVCELFLVLES